LGEELLHPIILRFDSGYLKGIKGLCNSFDNIFYAYLLNKHFALSADLRKRGKALDSQNIDSQPVLISLTF
jgi:hypothetical protein